MILLRQFSSIISVFTIFILSTSCLKTSERKKINPPSLGQNYDRGVSLGLAGEEGFNEISKTIAESKGRVIFTYWDKGLDDFTKNRPFENTIIEKNWKVINGEKWKILTLDSVPGSKWNAEDIMAYAKKQGQIDFDLMSIDELKAKNIGEIAKTPQYYSDLVRLSLLEAFGGTWIDSSVIMNDSLDNMFFSQMEAQQHKTLAGYTLSMHGSQKHRFSDGLENWFIMAKKGSKPLREWRKNTWKYIEDSPLRSENDRVINIFDRPLFKVDPKNKDPNHKSIIAEVRSSIRKQKAQYRNYLWGYSAWKKAIIEHPEFQNELIFREAGPEKYGPLGHEHLLDHISDQERAGLSAMLGDNRKKIAQRARLKAKNNPKYANFMALKFPSVISGFRRHKDEKGNPKYTVDRYANDSLIADLTKAGRINAKKPPVFIEEGQLVLDALNEKQAIMSGRFKDMPGGNLFRFGYPLFLLNRSFEEVTESSEDFVKRSSAFFDSQREEILRKYQRIVSNIEGDLANNTKLEASEKSNLESVLKRAKSAESDFKRFVSLNQAERNLILNQIAIDKKILNTQSKTNTRISLGVGVIIGAGITAGIFHGIDAMRKQKSNNTP